MRIAIFGALLLCLVFIATAAPAGQQGEQDDRPLSQQIAGKWALRTSTDRYLRHREFHQKWVVDLAQHNLECEHWIIEDHDGKVSLKPAVCILPGVTGYLTADADGTLGRDKGLWTPYRMKKREGMAIIFKGDNDLHLVTKNGTVTTQPKSGTIFWLEPIIKKEEKKEEEKQDGDELPHADHLSATIEGKRALKGHYGAYLRAWANTTDWFVGGSKDYKDCERWTIENHKEKVALKAHCSGKYLRSNEDKYVDLGEDAKDNGLWKPVKNNDGSFSFQGHHGTWLRAQPQGRISLQTGLNGGDEKFWLENWTDEIEGVRSLKSTHETYLRAHLCASDVDATIVNMAEHVKACEMWRIQLHGPKVSLMPIAEPGKYLRAYVDGTVGLSKKQDKPEERELWTPQMHEDGTWSLKSARGLLLSANDEGEVSTVSDGVATDSERFLIEVIENDD